MMAERGVSYTTALRLMTQDAEAKRQHDEKRAEEKPEATTKESEG